MADANSQILRQLGLNWLECRDEQGIFYFNQVTQQSSDSVPPELLNVAVGPAPMAVAAAPMVPVMAAPMAAPQTFNTTKAKVLSGGIQSMQQGGPQPLSYTPQMQVVQVPQPQSYVPQQMQQVQLIQQQAQQLAFQQQQQQRQQQQQVLVLPGQQLQQPVSYTPALQVQQQFQHPQQLVQQAEPAAALQKMAFGDWAVYEDEMGMFYMQVSTGVQFESPPPELMQAYQQYRAEQDQVHLQKLREIEMQKQQIDMQLAQQTQSLQNTYGFAGGLPCPAA